MAIPRLPPRSQFKFPEQPAQCLARLHESIGDHSRSGPKKAVRVRRRFKMTSRWRRFELALLEVVKKSRAGVSGAVVKIADRLVCERGSKRGLATAEMRLNFVFLFFFGGDP